MGSIFSRFFFTSSQSSSVITTTTSETASSSAMVLPSSEVSSKKKIKNNATDSKGNEHVLQQRACAAAKRLRKEFQDFTKDPPSHCSTGPVSTDDFGIFNWTGAIFGPDDTPFEGGVFFVAIRFREDYPATPPSIKFITKIFHPNVDKSGNIYLDILMEKWSPALTLSKMLISICSFLDDPNVDEAENRIATVYRDDRQKYDKIAREWTRNIEKKEWSKELFSIHSGYHNFINCTFKKWILDYEGSSLKELGRSLAVKPGLDGSKAED